VIGAVEVHPGLSRLGFPFDPLIPFGGRPLIARTVEAALRCGQVETVAVLAPSGHAAAVEAALACLPECTGADAGAGGGGRKRGRKERGLSPPAQGSAGGRVVVVPCEGEDVPERSNVRRLRRMAPHSWRAGWAIPFAVAEGGNPRWLLQALQRFQAARAILFPQAAPFLRPDLVEAQIVEAARHPGAGACLSTAPPGVAGDILSRDYLSDVVRAALPIDAPMRFLPDRPERSLDNQGVFHWFPEAVSGFTTRLTAESARGLAILSRIDADLRPERVEGAERWLERLSERGDILAGPVPEELRWWITARRRGVSSIDPGLPGDFEGEPDIDPTLFRRACEELRGWQESRIVLRGGEPLLHPRFGEILEAARGAGAGLVQVETDGLGLDERTVDLLAASADVVVVSLDALRPETYRALRGIDGLEEASAGVERLLERSARSGGPAVAVEMRIVAENESEREPFFDRWFVRTPFVVVRGPSDRAGQVPSRAVHPARTPRRIPCLQLLGTLAVLPDGRAVACENDYRGLFPVGDLRRESIEAIWSGPRLAELRAMHSSQTWDHHPLCSRCGDWCRR